MPTSWSAHAIWWHVYPLGFTGAPIWPTDGERDPAQWGTPENPVPRLRHLEGWLDYLIELGCNGVLLGPIFESQTHGYDTVDHFRIDPRLGGMDDFEALVAVCHERGIKILLDGVFNHVGREHPAFQHALQDPDSTAAHLFRTDPVTGEVATFEGHDSLVELDHSHASVVELVTGVMTHWLRRGADGWRLDAAYAVPTGFWAQVLTRVRAEFPEAWILGEVIHGDYPQIVADSGMDSLTQYELWKAIWSSLLDENFYELEWTLQRHNTFLDSFVPQTFVGNHDVTRIATQLPPAKAALAHVILFTVGGVPSIYYGDEQGFTGLKEERFGGDDAIRPAFPNSPGDLSPLGAQTHRLICDLIALRRRHPWLTAARTEVTHISNTSMGYDVLGAAGERLAVELSIENGPSATITASNGEIVLALDGLS